jgi:hypothetical protein
MCFEIHRMEVGIVETGVVIDQKLGVLGSNG